MTSLYYGDIVKVNGYDLGQQGTVIQNISNNKMLIQMGTKTMQVNEDEVTVMSRSFQDRNGFKRQLTLSVGDNVKYTYPNSSATSLGEHPVRYGKVVDIVSQNRVSVRWVGENEDSIERISRLKWIPMIPAWYQKYYG